MTLKRTVQIVGVILLALVVAGCQNMNRSGWGALGGAATGAAAGALIGGEEHRLEGALIGAAAGGGTGYLIGSQLDKRHQRKVMQEYNVLIQMDSREAVEERINKIADSVLGNSDGFAAANETSKAISELRNALDTAADEMGNRDGKTSSWERKEYLEKYRTRPLIQVLT